jgi:Ran GTPase-activating protein (RanGAP) involved in mRNA processing and transport
MATYSKPIIDNIKDVYAHKLFKNHDHWSHHHRETLHVVVASRPNGCPVFHHPRRQMKSAETHVMMKSPKSLDLFTVQERKRRVRILIEGVPGVGKTSFCLFLIDEWVNEIGFGEFKMVLFFPLRWLKPHSETTDVSNLELLLNEALTQIQIYEVSLCSSLLQWLMKNDGEGVLIIADGWDELNEKERHPGAFPYELIFGGLLSHASVIVTSRPLATAIPLEAIDKHIEILGFTKEAIKKYIQFEFTNDPQKGHSLMKEMESNATLNYMCTIPLNCATVCHLHRSARLDKLHSIPTVTKLYKEYVLTLLSDDNRCIVTFDALPRDVQKPWWDLCEFAYSTMTMNVLVFSQEEVVDYFHQWNEAVLRFKLLQSLECGTRLSTKTANCYQFLHMTFQEFLAALYISNKLSALEQNEVYEMYGQSSHFELVWKYFLGLSLPKSLGAIKSALLATEISTLDLCHFAIEVKESDADLSLQLMKKACKLPKFITPTAYDCDIVLRVIATVQDCSDISLNASNCVLRESDLDLLADGLYKMKNLALPGNKLSDNDVLKLFSKVSQTSQHIEKLDLCDNEIGEVGVRFMTKALTKLKSLRLSYNPLGISGIRALKSAIMSGALSDVQEIELQGTMTEDSSTNDELLEFFLNRLSYHCNKLQLFDISENFISSKGAGTLARNLSQKLQQLHMNHTTLDNEGFEAFFKTYEGECSFESLDMKSNHISSEGIQFLVEKVSSGMLLKGGIHLDENPLGMEAVLSIGQLLSNTHCLLSDLSLTDCQLSENISHDTSITANYVYRHLLQISQYSGLSQLKLDCNNFTEDSLQILTGFIHLCPYLKFLSSRCCQLTSVDLNALLTKLFEEKVHAEKLTTWCLANCNIGNDGVRDLIKYVPLIFPNLTDIHLDGNPVSAEVKSKLKETLSDNVKIKEKGNVHYDRVEADGGQPQDQSTLTYCRGV